MKYNSLVSLHTVTYIALKIAFINSSFNSSSFIIKSITIKAYSSLSILSNIISLYSALCTTLVFFLANFVFLKYLFYYLGFLVDLIFINYLFNYSSN